MKTVPQDAKGFAQWLVEHEACSEAREWATGKDLRTVWDTCPRGAWLEWLLDKARYKWPAAARAEYNRVTAESRAEYECVAAAAWPLYEPAARAELERVRAAAWAELDRVTSAAVRNLIPYPFDEGPNE